MNDLLVPTCVEPTVAFEPATISTIPCPFRFTDCVVVWVEANASSVTVPDCAAALPGKSRSAAARTESQRILMDRATVFLITSPSGFVFISVLLHEIPQLKLASGCAQPLRTPSKQSLRNVLEKDAYGRGLHDPVSPDPRSRPLLCTAALRSSL